MHRLACFALAAGLAGLPAVAHRPQAKPARIRPFSVDDRERLRQMLDQIAGIVERNYYDQSFHGLDLKGRLKIYQTRLATAPQDFDDLSYDLYTLEPRNHLQFVVRGADGAQRAVTVATKFVKRSSFGPSIPQSEALKKMDTDRSALAGNVFIWQVPEFAPQGISSKLWKQAQQHPAIVLDLRGNPGGKIYMLQDFFGDFLPKGVAIAQPVGRERAKPEMVHAHRPTYTGKLVVLVDSHSASAAELMARVLQLQHRATIVGSRSAVAVMESEIAGVASELGGACGVSVTLEDLIMAAGHSLEGVGVTPDVIVNPAPADLAAGHLFPYLWPPYKLSA